MSLRMMDNFEPCGSYKKNSYKNFIFFALQVVHIFVEILMQNIGQTFPIYCTYVAVAKQMYQCQQQMDQLASFKELCWMRKQRNISITS